MRFYSDSHSHSATDRSRERDGGSWVLVFVRVCDCARLVINNGDLGA